ncbi:MAG: redoxin domain-containing protein [Kordiimonadaceae bacterium]|nr:redoxin domain-containing protein [Kordiimonadaceae bacterium]
MTAALMISNLILWCVVIGLGVLVFALTRQIGVLHGRLAPAGALAMNAALKVGDKVPPQEHKSLTGGTVNLGDSDNKKKQLIFFMAPNCPVCKTLIPALKSLVKSEKDDLELILASDGDGVLQKLLIIDEKLDSFPYVLSERLGRQMGVSKLPYGVLIGADGIIKSFGLVNTREHLDSLLVAEELGVASIQDYLEKHHDHKHASS